MGQGSAQVGREEFSENVASWGLKEGGGREPNKNKCGKQEKKRYVQTFKYVKNLDLSEAMERGR